VDFCCICYALALTTVSTNLNASTLCLVFATWSCTLSDTLSPVLYTS
jgi:hypothetical protein